MTQPANLVMTWPAKAPNPEAAADAQAAPRSSTLRLTEAIRAGDTEAFAGFYRAWFDRAYALVRSSTRRDESFCLDVVQDAMLRVVKSLPPLAEAAALECWMTRVVRTTALDRLRQEARRARREERVAHRRAGESRVNRHDASEPLEMAERIAWVEARLEEADQVERALVKQRFESGESFRTLGEAFEISGNAASGRVSRLISRLRALAKEAFRG